VRDTDPTLFLGINDFARTTGWLHPIATGYANYGIGLFAMLLLTGWWLARRNSDRAVIAAAAWAPIAALAAVALNQPIAAAVDEPRPYAVWPNVLVLVHRGADPSFPSDHAVMAGAAAAALLLVHRRLGAVAAVAATVMAADRVYVGAHYPRDVLAGLALGAAIAVVGYLLIRPILTRLLDYLTRTRLRPLLSSDHGVDSESMIG